MANVWKTDGGSDCVFHPPLTEELTCAICHLVLKDPVQTICGHRFCKECLSEFHKSSSRTVCAMDNEELDPEKHIFPDNATKRQILSHCVECQNEECDWTGQLREFESHECQFQMVTCQKGECSVEVLRKKLAEHQENDCQWRDYQCGYCDGIFPFWKKPVHLQKCGKAPVKCTKRCKESEQNIILREELKDHLKNECSLAMVRCQYRQMGCKEKILRFEMQKHLDSQMQNHLQLACRKVSHVSNRVKKLEQDLELVKAMSNSNPPFIWRITDFEKRVKNAKCGSFRLIESDPFYSGPNGYKFKAVVYPNGCNEASGSHLSVFIVFLKGEYDAILPWPFLKRVTILILDQQEYGDNIVKTFTGDSLQESFKRPAPKNQMDWGYSRFTTHDNLKTRKYIVDNTLFLQVHVSK